MDELLELMEEDPPLESNPPNSNEDGVDEFLTLLEGHEEPEATQRTTNPTVVTPSNSTRTSPTNQSSSSSKTKPISAGIDDKLGIRMIDRNMSSVDLVDLVSMNPYYSPASLSAMSLAGLSRILVDPPTLVDQATVCGKTVVATVGIVFGNTGTRISAKGGAFCVLTIGTFVSGPCVSVMLFGDVYSRFCRSCVPGKVVALVNPKLMPIQPGAGKTSVSFCVYDSSQIILVARAKDYGICKGTIRAKDKDGKWSSCGGKCKNYVDKRKSDFCDVHRKQQQQQKKKTGGGSLLKLREQAIGFGPQRGTSVLVSQAGKLASNNRLLNSNTIATNLGPNVPLQMKRTLPSSSRQPQGTNISSNRLLNGTTRNTSPGVPLQQKDSNTSGNRLLHRKPTAANTNDKSSTGGAARVATQTKRRTGIVGTAPLKADRGGDWFQEAIAPVASANSRAASFVDAAKRKKRKTIHTGGGGFDGSVQVPKQSRLFQAPKTPLANTTSSTSTLPPQQTEEDKQKILENQAALAKLLQESNNATSNQKKKSRAKDKTKDSGSFYDALGAVNLEKAKNAKSRFATEVEAAEYAKSRQRVVELEKLETAKEKSKKKTGNENKVILHYICKSCGIESEQIPMRCVVSKHTVVKSRSLKENQTKADKRTVLHQKSAAEGGLRLGDGNEWSRNLKDFHS